jgi:WS/DGAT/MGAT family acyltransferase
MARTRRPGRADRLSALDLSNLRVEERGVPMHVAALALVDGAPLRDARGELRLPALREHVGARIPAGRLRQVLVPDGPGRRLRWREDPSFDPARHVHVRPVPVPGDEDALLRECCALDERPLARDRPLWELWLLPGLADGRVGLLLRWHHVVADGLAALALFAPLFDQPAGAPPAAPSTAPASPGAPRPGVGALVTAPLRQLVAAAREGRAPQVSFNRPVGPHRRLVLLRADLAATKEVAHRHGGTVNDVVLAAMAGGARRLLAARGELGPGTVLKVSVAVSLRPPGDAGGGNRVGVRVVPVPVWEPDPHERLRRIAATTSAQRRRPPYRPGGRVAQRWMVHVMDRQRLVNLLLSNLRGPERPLEFAGARVRELFQVGAVQGNLSLGVGVLSYAGALNLDVVADAEAVPDVEVFAAGTAEALGQLGATGP